MKQLRRNIVGAPLGHQNNQRRDQKVTKNHDEKLYKYHNVEELQHLDNQNLMWLFNKTKPFKLG